VCQAHLWGPALAAPAGAYAVAVAVAGVGGVGDVGGIVVVAAGDVGVVDVDRAGGGDRAGGIVRLAVAVHAVVAGAVETRGWRPGCNCVRDVGSARLKLS